ncbi:type VI secretion system baseplate subunit TssF [Pseudoduganella lutea]|uniref:Type VI secretion system baseplate subunit TssF n=1 Tax=Pseudoduganella lutea TaxID=321985 RepID=A0A4P6KVN9_9BURK|nr:type VI secretion system baseplate subunit TssF [Pseudoduganella lutea]QBE62735.1 type VI secretion system baseplate subunit TssF [Pseudoduganella lutea]
MEKLLPYYIRELAIIRGYVREFAQRFPRLAALFGLNGEVNADTSVERLIQTTAFLCARISWKLDHAHERFTNDLLGVQAPFYLRPIPSCSIVQVERTENTKGRTIARGTELHMKASPACGFRTAYDVTLAPITVSARFLPRAEVPANLGLPKDVGCAIAITIDTTQPSSTLEEAASVPVRVHIDADSPVRVALYDALFMRALGTYVEAGQQWRKLLALPFAAVGLSKGEALLPTPFDQEESLRLLAEYFAFPDKFDFFDIDLKAVLAGCPSGTRQLTLHVLLPDLHHTRTPNLLRTMPATVLRLGCTPVINMFTQSAEPIRLRKRHTIYTLALPRTADSQATVYSLDAMKLVQAGNGGTAVDMQMFYGGSFSSQHRWLFELAHPTMGTPDTVSFVDREQKPLQLGEGTVNARVTCTNGAAPPNLPIGRANGDLAARQDIGGGAIRMLRKPTAPLQLADHPDGHWDLIRIGHANHRNEAQQNLKSLLHLLRMHARPECAVTERQLAGILGISRYVVDAWIKYTKGSALRNGYAISITIDEEAFTDRSIAVFARVMESVLAYYMLLSNFIRVDILGKDGTVLLRGSLIHCVETPA